MAMAARLASLPGRQDAGGAVTPTGTARDSRLPVALRPEVNAMELSEEDQAALTAVLGKGPGRMAATPKAASRLGVLPGDDTRAPTRAKLCQDAADVVMASIGTDANENTWMAALHEELAGAAEADGVIRELCRAHGWTPEKWTCTPSREGLLGALIRLKARAVAKANLTDKDVAPVIKGEQNQIVEALRVQTAALEKLLGRKERDPLSGILSGEGDSAQSTTMGARGAAARHQLKAEFAENPAKIYEAVERNLRREVGAEGSSRPVYPREYLETRCPLGPYQGTVNWMFAVGQIHEYLQRGDPEHARALSALLLAAGEQMAIDSGAWHLAWLTTLLPEPPYALVAQHRATPNSLQPHSRLLEERWVAAHLAYLRDVDVIMERRKKVLNPKYGNEDPPARDPKGKGKGKEEPK